MPPPKTIFTSFERNALKDRWGSQKSRLGRDSFLPFGSCQLCLLESDDPVSCNSGDIFCRSCCIENMVSQRKEMKRLEKMAEREKLEEEDQRRQEEALAQIRSVEDFEAVQIGLSTRFGVTPKNGEVLSKNEIGPTPRNGDEDDQRRKRKFEIDEEELRRIASDDRSRAKSALNEEREAAKGHLPSFWVPGETPDQHFKPPERMKKSPTCPSSDPEHPHNLSLKTLTTVNFHEEKSPDTQKLVRTCPSCRKALSNSTKAMLAIPCGHVLCKPCVKKFLTPEHRHHRDAHDDGPDPETIHCYVCDADLLANPKARENNKDGKKKKEKEKTLKPGLVEIRSEGTGFASGGKAMVKKNGVAFQV